MATAGELREQAAENERRAAESFERSDTDGFLSQWAFGLSARRDRLAAEIAERGGVMKFPGLYDEHGRRIRARLVRHRNPWSGMDEQVWLVEGPDGEPIEWINRTSAEVGERPSKRSKMGKLGLHEEWEDAPAEARFFGNTNVGIAVARRDGGCPPDAVVLENEEAK